MSAAEEAARKIKMFIFDVDGTLTDGGIYVGEKGELFKPFNVRDGFAITEWHKAGGLSAVITGRESAMVAVRAKRLGITEVRQGNPDKRAAYRELKEKYGISDAEVAYVGDDIIDLPVMIKAGLPVAVADAAPEVRERALLVTERTGGHGAVREAVEFVLQAQGLWDKIVDRYLK